MHPVASLQKPLAVAQLLHQDICIQHQRFQDETVECAPAQLVYLISLVFYQLLQSINNVEITIFVEVAEVTSFQPAVWSDRCCSCFRITHIAFHDDWASDPELAAPPRPQHLAGGRVDDLRLHARRKPPHRSVRRRLLRPSHGG
ncbi:Os01g0901650, partial [Oryza sativa Japonica Group]